MKNKNQYLVILGATSGVGEKCAELWIKKGGSLILVARNKDRLEKIASKLEKNNSQNIIMYQCDVRKENDIVNICKEIELFYDDTKEITAMLNCIGYGLFEDFGSISYDETENMFKVNVLSAIAFNQFFSNFFKQQKKGHLINIASMAGKIATPKASIYSSTKFALIGYLNSLRLELAKDNIYVTTVNPGQINTNFFNTADPSGEYLKNLNKVFILSPKKVAKKIIKCVNKNKREINIPFIMNLGNVSYNLFPKLGDFLTRTVFNKK